MPIESPCVDDLRATVINDLHLARAESQPDCTFCGPVLYTVNYLYALPFPEYRSLAMGSRNDFFPSHMVRYTESCLDLITSPRVHDANTRVYGGALYADL